MLTADSGKVEEEGVLEVVRGEGGREGGGCGGDNDDTGTSATDGDADDGEIDDGGCEKGADVDWVFGRIDSLVSGSGDAFG